MIIVSETIETALIETGYLKFQNGKWNLLGIPTEWRYIDDSDDLEYFIEQNHL